VGARAPDGYTILIRPMGHECRERRDLSAQLDLEKDFGRIGLIATSPF